ncbi:betaine-aldehyde dehydrogenase [Gallaecimonas pentaromativorans]|uniref:Betaine aldehyde dehydrogenase n=1 Tax=Gallaecimonas pentaromativorans TaxID=584787 RepID=A0A3N1P2M0_9GAMM|nr:betaine-aldehyde dehydrogenase [Gallaecimonas pentaromativorans]ROQ22663.1 betaine aldehyde dehydrogenase [Gallaecimonas pentaromativorans]
MNSLPLYIHGRHVDAQSKQCFDNINPATEQRLCQVQKAGAADVEAAVASAKAGFKIWSAMSGMERKRILDKAVALLRQRNDELAKIEVLDTGKPLAEAIEVDVVTGADAIEFYAGLAPAIAGEQVPLGDEAFFYTRREPLGVCVGIGAWNYPIQIACWKAALALATGNAMIFKPAELTPTGALKLAEIFTEAGLPDGVFNVLQGDGETGALLTAHPGVAKVSLTGEVGTGKKVMAAAAGTLKEVTMELGGKSPLIIFDDADLDDAVSAALLANFYTQGEICTNGTRVFVHHSLHGAFVEKVVERSRAIRAGDPMDMNTQLGALISTGHMQQVLGAIEQGKKDGARLEVGGNRIGSTGAFVEATVFSGVTDDMALARDEIFGPVMSILTFEDEQEVIERANNTDFGLAAAVFTRDLKRGHRVIHQLQAGICWLNAYNLSPVEMPVGGYKASGIGRENGLESIRHYTQVKSVYVNLGGVESPF